MDPRTQEPLDKICRQNRETVPRAVQVYVTAAAAIAAALLCAWLWRITAGTLHTATRAQPTPESRQDPTQYPTDFRHTLSLRNAVVWPSDTH